MQANLRETATGYRVAFAKDVSEDPYLTLDCDYLDQMRYGILTTLTVRTTIDTAQRLPDGVILVDRINLMRGRELKDIAFRIDQVISPPTSSARMDWLRHLEHAAVLINDQLQAPVEAIDLTGVPLPTTPKFDIESFLAHRKSNVLYGPGGTGKSVLAVRLATSYVYGMDFLGLATHVADSQVLYLDWEDDAGTMVERLEKVSNGLGVPRTPMHYKSLHGKGPYERHHADVRHFLKENPQVGLVIFDSTAMAMHGSSQGDGADGAIKFFSLIGQLPATRLLLDHVSSDDLKSGNGTPKPYGSVFKANTARNMWEVKPWNQSMPGHGFTLRHRKTNVTRRHDDIEVEMTWDDERTVFDALDPDTF